MNATIYHNMMNAGESESIPALHRNILEFHHGVTLSRSQISLAGGEVSPSDLISMKMRLTGLEVWRKGSFRYRVVSVVNKRR